MQTLPRIFIKGSLLYLATGITLGGVMLAARGLRGSGLPFFWTTIHVHLLLVGFMLQFVFGVAYWMFPRNPKGWYTDRAAALTFWLLNAGLLLRVLTEPSFGEGQPAWSGWVQAISALLQVAAGLTFIYNIWSRVRSFQGSPAGKPTR